MYSIAKKIIKNQSLGKQQEKERYTRKHWTLGKKKEQVCK